MDKTGSYETLLFVQWKNTMLYNLQTNAEEKY